MINCENCLWMKLLPAAKLNGRFKAKRVCRCVKGVILDYTGSTEKLFILKNYAAKSERASWKRENCEYYSDMDE